MEIPLSIVITTYNRFDLLERCIQSILQQQYRNYEIIIVDDHSIPSYREDILNKYPNINYIYKDKNEGPGSARNIGISLAKNNFVIIMDDDDVFVDNAFHKIDEFIKKHQQLNFPVYHFLCSSTKTKSDFEYKILSFSEYLNGEVIGDVIHVLDKSVFLEGNKYRFPELKIGAEILLWYRVTLDYGYLIVNEIVVKVMDDSPQRLTNFDQQIQNAALFAQFQIDVINRFEKDMLKANSLSLVIDKYKGAVTYLLLAKQKKLAFNYCWRLCKFSKKYLLFFLLFLLPQKVITIMFYQYRISRRQKNNESTPYNHYVI